MGVTNKAVKERRYKEGREGRGEVGGGSSHLSWGPVCPSPTTRPTPRCPKGPGGGLEREREGERG